MTLRTLTPEIVQQVVYNDDVNGIVVTDVEPLSPASQAGIQVRDVIVSVQDRSAADVRGFQDVLKMYDLAKGIRSRVRTGVMRRFTFLNVSEQRRSPSSRNPQDGDGSQRRR